MSWTRSSFAALAVCVLLLTGSVSCGTSGKDGPDRPVATASAGRLLDDTDEDGRRLREVDREHAPEVGIEVQPEADGDWRVRLTVRSFRFSPAGTPATAAAGRGLAYLYVDGELVSRLRTPGHRLAARLVPRGTHHVTARLYADDGTVWAVDGKPVENTADITASDPADTTTADPATADPAGTTTADPAGALGGVAVAGVGGVTVVGSVAGVGGVTVAGASGATAAPVADAAGTAPGAPGDGERAS
ncbi:hypothetical protein AB0G32_22120 [Streptomyces sp. NPDC023723]|uniref:hypothetical protein n=1 Tax=Streptomyces sp. NPDC023723 TaxID=3154323 RepID=UPI0033C51142